MIFLPEVEGRIVVGIGQIFLFRHGLVEGRPGIRSDSIGEDIPYIFSDQGGRIALDQFAGFFIPFEGAQGVTCAKAPGPSGDKVCLEIETFQYSSP